jgi:hypothetical protein
MRSRPSTGTFQMASNPFDQFDQDTKANPFDAFDSTTDHSNIVAKSQEQGFSGGGRHGGIMSPMPDNHLPVQLPPYKERYAQPVSPFGQSAPPGTVQWSPAEKAKAAAGIDITSGAPHALRNQLSMMISPKEGDIKRVVNQYYGQDVDVQRDELGNITYRDPSSGRTTYLEGQGQNLKNLTPTVGGSMDTVLSGGAAAGAGVLAGASSGNPFLGAGASVVGGAVGQGASDVGKLVINSIMNNGANKPTFDENVEGVLKDSAKAGVNTAIGAGIGLLPAVGRLFGRYTPSINLKYGKATELLDQTAVATRDLNEYNTLVGNTKDLKPSIPELLPNDGEIRTVAERARKTSDALTAQEEKRVNSNLDALSYNYKNFSDSFKPSPDYQPGSSGFNMQQEFAQKKAQALAQQQLQDSFARANATRAAQGLPALSQTEMNQMSTEMLNTVESAGSDKVNKAYGDLKVMLGVPKETAYDRTSGSLLQGRKTNDVMELNAVTRAKIQNLWQKGKDLNTTSPGKNGDKYWAAIPEDFLETPSHPENGLADLTTKKYDILSTIENVQDIHNGVRNAMRASRGQIQPDDQAAAHTADILEENIGWHLETKGDPKILDAWENAKQLNRQYNADFRQGILNQVMTREGGFTSPVYTTSTAKLLMSAGKGADQSGVAKLADVLKGDPNANENVRSMIWSIYKEHYLPQDGVPTAATFSKFKDDLQGPIRHFFGDDDLAKMSSFSDMTDKLAASAKSLKLFNQAWRASPEYGGIPTNSQALTRAVFQQKTAPQVLDKMVSVLKATRPDLLKEWQADTAQELARTVSDKAGVPVASNLNSLLNNLSPRIEKVMGPEFVANLRAVQKAASMAQSGPGVVQLSPDKPQSIMTQAVRAMFAPPMSSEGRWYSGLLEWRKRAAGRVVYNALSSPEGLKAFVATSRNQATSPTAAAVLGNLNGRSLISTLNKDRTKAPQQQQDQDDVRTP